MEQLRIVDAAALSKAMVENHGMSEVERRRLLRAISIAQAAAPSCTSSWHRYQAGALRTH